MNMHKSLVAVLGLILISSTASAATCRAGSAAQAGSNTGYERARAAADAWSQRENDVSSSLQSCLSRIKKNQHKPPPVPPALTTFCRSWKTSLRRGRGQGE